MTAERRSIWTRLAALDRNVRSMGFVSFFADLSSEMVYPLFPLFVTGVLGAPAALLGLIEGIAEATASITKLPFGQWSDFIGRRRPFAAGGYGLAAAGKLLLAVAVVWPLALAGRFIDRLGKGMRSAPRDALLAASTRPEERGIGFGLHRSMDTLGAVLGPLTALLLIELGVSLRLIFALAAVPGVISVVIIIWFVRERPSPGCHAAFRLSLPRVSAFRWLLLSALIFGVGNSSDMFILLKAQSIGAGPTGVILLYVLFNAVYAAVSTPAGHLSDRVGQLPLMLAGYCAFALVYVGFAVAGSLWALVGLFAVYGVYIAATEGTSKALVSRVLPAKEHGAGLGMYYTASGVASFAASTIGGALWSAVGSWATFAYGAGCALLAAMVLGAARLRLGPVAMGSGQDAMGAERHMADPL